MVDNFNESRLKLQKFIQEINYLLEMKTKINIKMQIKKRKKLGISTRIPKFKKCFQINRSSTSEETLLRLKQKLWKIELSKDPYSEDDENEIFLKMYRNVEVRKYCEDSLIYLTQHYSLTRN